MRNVFINDNGNILWESGELALCINGEFNCHLDCVACEPIKQNGKDAIRLECFPKPKIFMVIDGPKKEGE